MDGSMKSKVRFSNRERGTAVLACGSGECPRRGAQLGRAKDRSARTALLGALLAVGPAILAGMARGFVAVGILARVLVSVGRTVVGAVTGVVVPAVVCVTFGTNEELKVPARLVKSTLEN